MLYQLSYSRPKFCQYRFNYVQWWWMLDSNQRRRKPAGLQPAPFSHSGNPPTKTYSDSYCFRAIAGAGEGSRTPDLLITNQLLCQLSYASKNKHKKAADSEETAIPYSSEHSQEMSRAQREYQS